MKSDNDSRVDGEDLLISADLEKSKNLADRPESAENILGIKTYVLGGHAL